MVKMAMMAVPQNPVTMPRKRRPRASAGEVFITSKSVIYLMDANQNGEPSQCDGNSSALRDIIYENVELKNRNDNKNQNRYSCSIRTKDIIDANDATADRPESACESQHVSIYIGEHLYINLGDVQC